MTKLLIPKHATLISKHPVLFEKFKCLMHKKGIGLNINPASASIEQFYQTSAAQQWTIIQGVY